MPYGILDDTAALCVRLPVRLSVCVCIHTLVHVKGENGLSPRMCSERFIRVVVPVNQSSALPGTAATFPTEHYY